MLPLARRVEMCGLCRCSSLGGHHTVDVSKEGSIPFSGAIIKAHTDPPDSKGDIY